MVRLQKIAEARRFSKRAVSEIIVTMLLLSITIIGGVLIWSTLSGSQEQLSVETQVETVAGTERDIIIVGYDTRDGSDLGGLSGLSNTNSGALISGEYIVVTLRDRLKGEISIEKVLVNEQEHTWQSSTSTCTVTTTPSLSGCGTLSAGSFFVINSVIPPSASTVVNQSQLVLEGTDVSLVIRLCDDSVNPPCTSDLSIPINKTIRLSVVVAGFDPTNFVITSGGTR